MNDYEVICQSHRHVGHRLYPFVYRSFPDGGQAAVRLAPENSFSAIVPHSAVLHVVPGYKDLPALLLRLPLFDCVPV